MGTDMVGTNNLVQCKGVGTFSGVFLNGLPMVIPARCY